MNSYMYAASVGFAFPSLDVYNQVIKSFGEALHKHYPGGNYLGEHMHVH